MRHIGHLFIELPTVNSTNIYAMEQVHARLAKHGTAFFAHEQTQGKGQRGKTWNSSKDENILLSVVYEPLSLHPASAFALSAAVALACYRFCKVYTGDEMSIKWPNDLYWRDRKAGGILIENNIRGERWEFAIAGIGLNINQVHFPPELRNPVSFRQITGKTFPAVTLAAELCDHLQESWSILSRNPEMVIREYNDALYKRGEKVRLKQASRIFDARIKGVNSNGQLEVFTTVAEQFNFGEVSWLL
jgi:BirA family transcriptional regulator, biotin operon repressor / biotin---[acetyl-CoA-carboxylase] ligase